MSRKSLSSKAVPEYTLDYNTMLVIQKEIFDSHSVALGVETATGGRQG
jgi:hypothetical protein